MIIRNDCPQRFNVNFPPIFQHVTWHGVGHSVAFLRTNKEMNLTIAIWSSKLHLNRLQLNSSINSTAEIFEASFPDFIRVRSYRVKMFYVEGCLWVVGFWNKFSNWKETKGDRGSRFDSMHRRSHWSGVGVGVGVGLDPVASAEVSPTDSWFSCFVENWMGAKAT